MGTKDTAPSTHPEASHHRDRPAALAAAMWRPAGSGRFVTCSKIKPISCRPTHIEPSKRLENSQCRSLPTCCLTAGGVSSSSSQYVSY